MNTYRFHVHGMHCKSCSVLIENDLKESVGVRNLHVNYEKKELDVSGDFGGIAPEKIAELFTKKIEQHGYSVSLEKERRAKAKLSDFNLAIPFALAFMAAFILLQKTGIVSFGASGTMTLGTVFIIGLIASVSTCMAVVGGLLLSMSATYAKEGQGLRPQAMFHIGRLISFFILGGVIGALGTAFQLSGTAHLLIGVVIAFIMIILGLNLLDVPFVEKLQLTLPAGLSKKVFRHAKGSQVFAPFLLGAATFFLPCGFTQSMQLYSLTTGSYLNGAMTMLVFALGTLPVLSLLSFGSVSINKSKYAGVFFKTVGIVVIAFALYNFLNTLVVAGIIAPVFSF
ncbi:MAG: hypothetical protein A3H57_03115 [Candidatus Taylorbacteria bacterium RIFCSPLOWO2_02_FULL_43_11]|uniref:HMA domain-containing protein n=1 Tax=Candidatus Taylorbacteria bacterium RIFCSPHIGHO2_02_FULL_43_32b TaxID=1802306 RepID=A0A1G2MLG9_9BACT|nr:MAG: hypothetical protein A2743_03210 [Candidatus Taylorbacteria bacterium RIFCSPHIGHO2_01_FULL_43_47]OHA24755.1 MAG: hypothetical protein A3C72_00775 [Candidatus Taylorbacteria bacterium RIFCSPHIGHO2_02_FULL_43_32b]OHA35394.1 MAG: hypothetical protein A3H57_03115 [Candidatus Taylorbacteria bacterium RIFCSPLOWO2_02_FULL_43_11]